MNGIFTKALLGLALTAALAGCGNQKDRGTMLKAVKETVLKKKSGANSGPSQQQLAATITNALSRTSRNVAIAVVESRDAFAVMTEIERNGAVTTWASPDRRSLSLRGGVIIATRGLGFDIMSSETSGTRALLAARSSGSATRVLRLLDGENQTHEKRLSCTITRGGTQGINIGEIKANTVKMTEACQGGGMSFENTYLVDGSGRVVQSRQWLGAENGYIFWQFLRR